MASVSLAEVWGPRCMPWAPREVSLGTEEINAREAARTIYTAALTEEETAEIAFAKAVEIVQVFLKVSVKEAGEFVEQQVIKK